MNLRPPNNHHPAMLAVAVFAMLIAWMFGRALISGELFAFRDVAHFYYPLFESIQKEWAAGRVPLWDPTENLGMPLAGSGTSSVFYPGKLLFFLPIGMENAFRLYIVGHVVFAGWAAYRLARENGLGQTASGMAALAYAFSGSVLYQYCNVVYLVSAAWTPLAVIAGMNIRRRRRLSGSALLGATLAMMILGGDPQSAYHTGMLAAAVIWWPDGENRVLTLAGHSWRHLHRSRLVLLSLAVATTVVLSAVQLLPLREFAGESDRSLRMHPRNVYEAASYWTASSEERETASALIPEPNAWYDTILCRRLERTAHERFAYQFSVGPWRLAELAWPNVGGRQFPTHTRWFEIIPSERRIWTPTLYFGVIPLILACAALCLRPSKSATRSLWTWAALFAIIASFGRYGLVWLLRSAATACHIPFPAEETLGDPVGGLYWLMNVALPIYADFRYSAKWWTIAALALAMLAGQGADRLITGSPFAPKAIRRSAWGFAIASGIGASALVVFRAQWLAWTSAIESDPMFGPFLAEAAWRQTVFALGQTIVVLALFLVWLCWTQTGKPHHAWAGAALLCLVAADIGLANRWLVVTAPQELWSNRGATADAILADQGEDDAPGPTRVYRYRTWYPRWWAKNACSRRFEESVAWDHDALAPKYHYGSGLALSETHGTMTPAGYFAFLCNIRAYEKTPVSALEFMGAQYAVLPREDLIDGAEFVAPVAWRENTDAPADVAVVRYVRPTPRAWIVHRSTTVPTVKSDNLHVMAEWTRRVFWPNRRPRNIYGEAVIEADLESLPQEERRVLAYINETAATAHAPVGEACRITSFEPNRVAMSVCLEQPGVVVLREQFYPGWEAVVSSVSAAQGGAGEGVRTNRRATVLRTNCFMRGLALEPGEHEIVFAYRPRSFIIGAWISVLAWTVLAMICAGAWWRKSRSRRSPKRSPKGRERPG